MYFFYSSKCTSEQHKITVFYNVYLYKFMFNAGQSVSHSNIVYRKHKDGLTWKNYKLLFKQSYGFYLLFTFQSVFVILTLLSKATSSL